MRYALVATALAGTVLTTAQPAFAEAPAGRQATPASDVSISGELRQWHKVTLTLAGPHADERSNTPNPFVDYRMTVTFSHESGSPVYRVPGYFAGDGDAANTSATSGNTWRAHVAPDKAGRWTYRISFVSGKGVALLGASPGQPVPPFDGRAGTFQVGASDKKSPDLRARGRLQYAGKHYLQFAGTGDYFLKLGADSPETLLAYADFDGTIARKPQVPLHTFTPHVQDWRAGDPTWKADKGKGLIGAINYLSSKGVNSISFLPYNAGGDGDNVWPFVERDDKFHYDVSKLDQWQVVFEHAQRKGLYLHFKLQENEIDDNVRGNPNDKGRGSIANAEPVRESLDGGDLGQERRLYVRELVARFGYLLALNWNIGEENTQSSEQQLAMAMNLRDADPYGGHHIVVHTFPNGQESVYPALLGSLSPFTGASLQMAWNAVHERTWRWVLASTQAKKPWVVANDEQGPAGLGVPPDPGYSSFAGKDAQGRDVGYTLHDIRKYTLWGNLMAGGAGVEYYFGYGLADNDLVAENFRSRDTSWDYGRIAIDFFHSQKIPFWEMTNADALVGNEKHDNSRYCFAKANEVYLVYLPSGGTATLDLSKAAGQFTVEWFDPRNGGVLKKGSVASVKGGGPAALGTPPDNVVEDWLAVVRPSAQPGAAGRPNILLLYADDWRHDTLGAAGHPIVRTPHLDRLATEGVRFSRSYVTTSICGVSRASLLTGQWMSRHGNTAFDAFTTPWEETFPGLLRAQGYWVGHVGKWHNGRFPAERFDFGRAYGGTHYLKQPDGTAIHVTQKNEDDAREFLRTRPPDRPFVLTVAFFATHAEDQNPKQFLYQPQSEALYQDVTIPVPPNMDDAFFARLPPFLANEKNEGRNRWRWRFDTPAKYQQYMKAYYRLATEVDAAVGRLLAELRTLGLDDNTLVIFTTDNGYFHGEHGLADKWYPYEESIRVPLIVRDPRVPSERRGRINDDIVLNVDLAPTLLASAGIAAPPRMQGRDIAPLYLSARKPVWRNEFFYEHATFRSVDFIPASEALVRTDVKYIRWPDFGYEELFDLRRDPREVHNLAGDRQSAALLARLRTRFAELKALAK